MNKQKRIREIKSADKRRKKREKKGRGGVGTRSHAHTHILRKINKIKGFATFIFKFVQYNQAEFLHLFYKIGCANWS